MSKIREAKLSAVNATTIVAGARALGLKATERTIDFGVSRGVFQVSKNGSLQGDYDYVTSVAGIEIPSAISARPQAVVGILAQAGSISRIAEHLSSSGWTPEVNYRAGTLNATRGTSESISVSADRTGKIKSEGTNFEGNSCSLVLDHFMDLLGDYKIENETMKTEEVQVIRTVK